MQTNTRFLERYVNQAPLALAIERSLECRILSQMPFERPVLDIGCGEGLFAKILFAEKIDTGIDPDARELLRADELAAYHRLIPCRGDAIPEPDASYRTVFSNSVIEHIPRIEPVLREAFRVLSPGGRLYITVPSDRFDEYAGASQVLGLLGTRKLQRRFRAFYNRFWGHYHLYAPERWGDIVRAIGFEIIETRSYAPRHVCLIDDLLVPFSVPALIIKRLTNRWILFPRLRRILLAPVRPLLELSVRHADHCEDGGLVFIAARKP